MRAGDFHVEERDWSGTTKLRLHLVMTPATVARPGGRVAIRNGPLIYAFPIGEDWRRLRGEPPRADWEVHPTTPWNYAIVPAAHIDAKAGRVGDVPFARDNPPARLVVKGRRVPGWRIEHNAAALPPASPVKTEEPLEDLTLVPYGCARLRIAEFPALST
jgi:hypothetical protein